MSEEVRSRRKETESWTVIPNFVDRMFDTVEIFTERLMLILSDTTEALVNRAVQRMFGLLLLGVGLVFILMGGAEILNQIFRFPGVGEVIVGAFLLFITSTVLLLTRKR